MRKHQFHSEHFEHDVQNDQFICPVNCRLSYLYTSQLKTANGYPSTRRPYECESCQGCALKSQCTKGNRHIQISFQLREYRRQARENLTSERGLQLRAQRSVNTETVFGNPKHNMGFRRFHRHGQEKVQTDWMLAALLIICEN